ncbi:MAG: TIGR02281 family clan AA aspartic protease [Oleiphilaceae bacterium]|nr:TIGR02281 family clan AA aspartic protease [Oleiphilaceae bacterium]
MASSRPEIRYLMIFVGFWGVLLFGASQFFGAWNEQQRNPNQQLVSHSRGGATEIELQANRQGHYLANGTINQQPVTFILDTGATTVAVSDDIARKAGLQRRQEGRARTAAGTVRVWSTTIDQLRLGDMTFHNVKATINPSMDEDMVLLGMSALSQVDFSQQAGTLTLRQRQP